MQETLRAIIMAAKELSERDGFSVAISALAGGVCHILSESIKGESARSIFRASAMLFIAVCVGYFSVDLFEFFGLPAKLASAVAFGAAFSWQKLISILEDADPNALISFLRRYRGK